MTPDAREQLRLWAPRIRDELRKSAAAKPAVFPNDVELSAWQELEILGYAHSEGAGRTGPFYLTDKGLAADIL